MYLRLFTKDRGHSERVYLSLSRTLVKFGIVEPRNLEIDEMVQGVAIRRMTHLKSEEIELIEDVCDCVLDCCNYSENHYPLIKIQERVLKKFKAEFLAISKSFRVWDSAQNNEGEWVKGEEVKE